MASLFTPPFLDVGSGIVPADGAKITFRNPGLETNKDTFTTALADIAHTNPVVANALGVFPQIFIEGDYDWVLQDKNNVQKNTGTTSEFLTSTDAPLTFNTKDLAIAAGLVIGGSVQTLGYSTLGDGGDGLYAIVAAGTGTDDGGFFLNSNPIGSFQLQLIATSVNVRQFGAVGDEVTDDAAAIQAALNTGIPIIDDGVAAFKISTTLLYNRTISDEMVIRGNLRLRPDITVRAFTITGGEGVGGSSSATSFMTTTTSRIGAVSFDVNDATGMAVGDIITIKDTVALWPWNGTGDTLNNGELNSIRSISGNTITLAEGLYLPYTGASTVVVATFTPLKVDIEGLEIVYASGSTVAGMTMASVSDSVISRLKFIGPTTQGLAASFMYNVTFEDFEFIDVSLSGFGYGCQIGEATSCTFNAGYTRNCRHGIDFSGGGFPTWNCTVSNSRLIGQNVEGSGTGSHVGAARSNFINNVISGAIGIQSRGPITICKGNIFSNCDVCILIAAGSNIVQGNSSLLFDEAGAVIDSTNNNFCTVTILAGTVLVGEDTFYQLDTKGQNLIENNHVAVIQSFLFFQHDFIQNFCVRNNSVVISNNSGGTATAFMFRSAPVTLDSKSAVYNNRIVNLTGTYTKFSNILLDQCVTDWVDLSSTTLLTGTNGIEKVSGAGTVGTIVYNFGRFHRDPTGEMIRIKANVTFTISGGSTVIKWAGLVGGDVRAQTVYKVTEAGAANVSVGFKTTDSTSFFIGNSNTDPETAWGNGTFTVEFDIEFEYKDNTLS